MQDKFTLNDIFFTALSRVLSLKKWKQIQLAEATGIAPGRINEYVKGRRLPKEEAQHKIASALGYELVDFLALGRQITESSNFQKATLPGWLNDALPDLIGLDKNGQKAVKAAIDAFKKN